MWFQSNILFPTYLKNRAACLEQRVNKLIWHHEHTWMQFCLCPSETEGVFFLPVKIADLCNFTRYTLHSRTLLCLRLEISLRKKEKQWQWRSKRLRHAFVSKVEWVGCIRNAKVTGDTVQSLSPLFRLPTFSLFSRCHAFSVQPTVFVISSSSSLYISPSPLCPHPHLPCNTCFWTFLSHCSSCCFFYPPLCTALRKRGDTSGMYYILLITQYQRILSILFAQIEQCSLEIKSLLPFWLCIWAWFSRCRANKPLQTLFMTQMLQQYN